MYQFTVSLDEGPLANQPAIVPYCVINVIVWAVYFTGRLVATRAFPAWRVTTALFCIQFTTDFISVSPQSLA